MSIPAHTSETAGYAARLFAIVRTSVVQLLSSPSQPMRAEATRRFTRQALLSIVFATILIAALMFWFDALEISLMPHRGTPSLWLARALTDFGKDVYVLSLTAVLLLASVLIAPAVSGPSRDWLLGFSVRLQFVLLAISVPLVVGQALKWTVGRGRPFVGPNPDALNFIPLAGKEPYFSFPSAHSITAVALAFAVAAVWPRMRGVMIAYALVIVFTRLVLLAHHPSDVVAGASLAIIGALCVRYWFAVRGLGFAVGVNGAISPVALGSPKGVAEPAQAS